MCMRITVHRSNQYKHALNINHPTIYPILYSGTPYCIHNTQYQTIPYHTCEMMKFLRACTLTPLRTQPWMVGKRGSNQPY
ncbi:hypothetical protein EON63_04405 [archaeon]|nr:MAG: hypothetical protein EON63_04405 [archaeon]